MQEKSRNKFAIMESIFSVKGPKASSTRAIFLWQMFDRLDGKANICQQSKVSVPIMALDSRDRQKQVKQGGLLSRLQVTPRKIWCSVDSVFLRCLCTPRWDPSGHTKTHYGSAQAPRIPNFPQIVSSLSQTC